MFTATELGYPIAYMHRGFAFGLCLPIVFVIASKLQVDGSTCVSVNGVFILGVALGPTVAAALCGVGGNLLLASVTLFAAFVSDIQ